MLRFEWKRTTDSEQLHALFRNPQTNTAFFFLFLCYKPVTNAPGCENTVSVFLLAQSQTADRLLFTVAIFRQ